MLRKAPCWWCFRQTKGSQPFWGCDQTAKHIAEKKRLARPRRTATPTTPALLPDERRRSLGFDFQSFDSGEAEPNCRGVLPVCPSQMSNRYTRESDSRLVREQALHGCSQLCLSIGTMHNRRCSLACRAVWGGPVDVLGRSLGMQFGARVHFCEIETLRGGVARDVRAIIHLLFGIQVLCWCSCLHVSPNSGNPEKLLVPYKPKQNGWVSFWFAVNPNARMPRPARKARVMPQLNCALRGTCVTPMPMSRPKFDAKETSGSHSPVASSWK